MTESSDNKQTWWVYILRCRDDSLYTGCTVDLAVRVAKHAAGRGLGAKYTRSRLPVQLVYSEQVVDRSAALRREAIIKRLSRLQKQLLVNSHIQTAPKMP